MSELIILEAYQDFISTYRLSEEYAFTLLVQPTPRKIYQLIKVNHKNYQKMHKLGSLLQEDSGADRTTQLIGQLARPYRSMDTKIFRAKQNRIIKATLARALFNKMPQLVKEWTHPYLQKALSNVLVIEQEIASRIDPHNPYEALMQEHNPEFSDEQLQQTIDQLTALCANIHGHAVKEYSPLHHRMEQDVLPRRQAKGVMRDLVDQMGIPSGKVRLYSSASPAALGSPERVFIANNYNYHFLDMLGNGIHEVGHGHHKLNLPNQLQHSPLGRPLGTFHDEGLAYFWEHQILKSEAGVTYTSKLAAEEGLDPHIWTPENIMSYNQLVRLGPKRLDNCDFGNLLHLIALTKIERDIMNGVADPKDYHAMWRQQVGELTQQAIPENNFDYSKNFQPFAGLVVFPGYLWGYMAAAQMYQGARQNMPDLDGKIATGQWQETAQWLTQNFHSFGSQHSSDDLYQKATGTGLNMTALKAYFEHRYRP